MWARTELIVQHVKSKIIFVCLTKVPISKDKRQITLEPVVFFFFGSNDCVGVAIF